MLSPIVSIWLRNLLVVPLCALEASAVALRWPACRACPHYPPVARLLNEMEDQRPLDAPEPDELGGDPAQIEECQIAAFEAGDEDWWRYGVDFVAYAKNEFGDWAPIEDQDEGDTGGASGPR